MLNSDPMVDTRLPLHGKDQSDIWYRSDYKYGGLNAACTHSCQAIHPVKFFSILL
jgi:hypothetical protein